MKLERILPFSKSLLKQFVSDGSIAVDATCGNGHDTLFLAQLVGENGKVYGFDIQQEALKQTTIHLRQAKMQQRVTLFHACHTEMQRLIPKTLHQQISSVVFNLGYLPGGNHQITTCADSTISAVKQALNLIQIGGLVLLIVYPGHEAGKVESHAVFSWVKQLPGDLYDVLHYAYINKKKAPPYILAIEKK